MISLPTKRRLFLNTCKGSAKEVFVRDLVAAVVKKTNQERLQRNCINKKLYESLECVSRAITLLVFSALYMVVFERDVIRAVSQGAPISQLLPSVSWTVEPATRSGDVENTDESTAEPSGPKDDDRVAVKVVAVRSQGQEIDNAVILRGQTEATRKVDVRAETTGQVVSEPLRKGARVERGDVLCQLDPGTREIALSDALARAAEAEARVLKLRRVCKRHKVGLMRPKSITTRPKNLLKMGLQRKRVSPPRSRRKSGPSRGGQCASAV